MTTFTSILILVLVAAIILAVLFVFFHIFIALIPVALVLAGVIWLINRFSKNKNNDNMPNSETAFKRQNNETSGHKKARNVTVKDINDK